MSTIRRDYRAIATILHKRRHLGYAAVTLIARDLCDYFKKDNPLFDPERFLAMVLTGKDYRSGKPRQTPQDASGSTGEGDSYPPSSPVENVDPRPVQGHQEGRESAGLVNPDHFYSEHDPLEYHNLPIYTGKENRKKLVEQWGLPNSVPIEGDSLKYPICWSGRLFVDDNNNGKLIALWVPEGKIRCKILGNPISNSDLAELIWDEKLRNLHD